MSQIKDPATTKGKNYALEQLTLRRDNKPEKIDN